MSDFWHGIEAEDPEPPEHPPIPEVRHRLTLTASGLRSGRLSADEAAAQIEQFIEWLWRRPAIRRAPPDSKPVTPEMRQRTATALTSLIGEAIARKRAESALRKSEANCGPTRRRPALARTERDR